MKINTIDKNINDHNIQQNHDLKDIIIINNISDLDSLQVLWNRLHEKQSYKTIFNSYHWIKSSWAWHEKQGVPTIICFYAGHELIGIMPLVITITGKKTVLKFLDNPLTQYCDLLIDPQYIEQVIKMLFKLLMVWGNHWDVLDLAAVPEHSILYKKLYHAKSSDIPFKYKITTCQKSSFTKINMLAHNWEEWLAKQTKASNKAFNKLHDYYKESIIYKPTDGDTEKNTVTVTKEFITLIDKKSTAPNLSQHEKLVVINNFLKRLCHYNGENQWLKSFDCYNKQKTVGNQYLILDNKNLYYLPSLEVSESSNSIKNYLQSLVIKDSLHHNIGKAYFSEKMYPWQKLWPSETENLHKIQIFNKYRKWF